MHNDRELETLFKTIEENHKQNSYVKKAFKVLVTLKEILKIYRIIQYFKNIFKCNMVKNIFKIDKKIAFLLKKIISV